MQGLSNIVKQIEKWPDLSDEIYEHYRPLSFSFIELYFSNNVNMIKEIALEGARIIREFYTPQIGQPRKLLAKIKMGGQPIAHMFLEWGA